MSKYKSKLAQEVVQYEALLRGGTLLAIDPSSGSAGSLPGYALFQKGQLVDAGTIQLPRHGRHIANRLWQLRECLLTAFDKPDILAVEWIAPVFPARKAGPGGAPQFLHKSASALMKSVGAIMSVWDVPCIEPAPTTWHTMTPPGYVKNDANDAQMVGWCALTVLARVLGQPDPIIHLLGETKP